MSAALCDKRSPLQQDIVCAFRASPIAVVVSERLPVLNDASAVAVVASDHAPIVLHVALDRVRAALPSVTLDITGDARHFS
jgi:hypothetical protein